MGKKNMKKAIYVYAFNGELEVTSMQFVFREEFTTDDMLDLANRIAYVAPDTKEIYMISNRLGLRTDYVRALKEGNQERVVFHDLIAESGIPVPFVVSRTMEEDANVASEEEV